MYRPLEFPDWKYVYSPSLKVHTLSIRYDCYEPFK